MSEKFITLSGDLRRDRLGASWQYLLGEFIFDGCRNRKPSGLNRSRRWYRSICSRRWGQQFQTFML